MSPNSSRLNSERSRPSPCSPESAPPNSSTRSLIASAIARSLTRSAASFEVQQRPGVDQADAGVAIDRHRRVVLGADLAEAANIGAQLLGGHRRVLDKRLGLAVGRDRLEQRHAGLAHLDHGALLLGRDRPRKVEIQLVMLAQVVLLAGRGRPARLRACRRKTRPGAARPACRSQTRPGAASTRAMCGPGRAGSRPSARRRRACTPGMAPPRRARPRATRRPRCRSRCAWGAAPAGPWPPA